MSVLRQHRDVDAVLLPKKDLRCEDREDVLVVRVDVRCLVKEDVREHVVLRVGLCERRFDRHRLAVAVDYVMLVPLKENPQDAPLEQLLVDLRDGREVLHITGASDGRRGSSPRTHLFNNPLTSCLSKYHILVWLHEPQSEF